MKLELAPWGESLGELVDVSRRAEAAGFERVWFSELHRSAFVPAAAAGQATTTIGIGTAIALAFVRSPLVTALNALDLDELTGGRFTLGLGAGVRRLNEEWHHATFGRPVAHLRETVAAVRAVFDGARTGEDVDVDGAWEPVRIRGWRRPYPPVRPRVPVYLAAVGAAMTGLAGEVGDGWISHELCSPRWLAEVVAPRLAAGGRTPEVVVSACCALDDDAERARAAARPTVAFYASVRTYAPFFAFHGFAAEAAEIAERFRARDHAGMLAACPDEMVDALTLTGSPGAVRARLAEYDGWASAAKVSAPTHGLHPTVMRTLQERLLDALPSARA